MLPRPSRGDTDYAHRKIERAKNNRLPGMLDAAYTTRTFSAGRLALGRTFSHRLDPEMPLCCVRERPLWIGLRTVDKGLRALLLTAASRPDRQEHRVGVSLVREVAALTAGRRTPDQPPPGRGLCGAGVAAGLSGRRGVRSPPWSLPPRIDPESKRQRSRAPIDPAVHAAAASVLLDANGLGGGAGRLDAPDDGGGR